MSATSRRGHSEPRCPRFACPVCEGVGVLAVRAVTSSRERGFSRIAGRLGDGLAMLSESSWHIAPFFAFQSTVSTLDIRLVCDVVVGEAAGSRPAGKQLRTDDGPPECGGRGLCSQVSPRFPPLSRWPTPACVSPPSRLWVSRMPRCSPGAGRVQPVLRPRGCGGMECLSDLASRRGLAKILRVRGMMG
jgi:hypothetical protein